ncbi:MAG: hypothetical protein H6R10_975 [Rhodocyclaceae bacterium]|nr:hypothetical protein [Rhodocyclaceae bacterium]
MKPSRNSQQGAMAVLVAVAIVVLVAFVGLAVDTGRLYVHKAEIQNAMDACSLAAARELTGVNANQLEQAENAGLTVGNRNLVNFQDQAIALAASDITFSQTLNGSYQTRSAISPANAVKMKYARCRWTKTGIPMYFMGVLAVGDQSVGGLATATLGPSQTSCGIPLGMCKKPMPASCKYGTPGPLGHCPGDWVDGRFEAGGGSTGSFNWIDFSPPAGGASELGGLLTGNGQCNLQVTNPVGQTGVDSAAAVKWNSRFGLYKSGAGNPQASTAPPDFTGFSYTDTNWPAPDPAYPAFHDAYGQFAGAAGNFMAKRNSFASYGDTVDTVDAGNALTGLSISNAYSVLSHGPGGDHKAYGNDQRRIAVAPIVDCAGWASSQTVPIIDWACVLMLNPIDGVGAEVKLEYLGMAKDSGSPCSTTGLPGGPGSVGPNVPVLVQ